ncbi:monocarboxylate transporter 9 [Lingula anatina]|uniref:Monocarboxylate transporter 9 n=1 Tax=Lingula anatina TaxID=7574 RepID=A0A1S3HIS3_LINAN|nr:monocarboxylate transporter 9 [Lingula anatina]|eukprot:XP_013386020.1 monocarboxylate transporter 9 [Lingula anatina]
MESSTKAIPLHSSAPIICDPRTPPAKNGVEKEKLFLASDPSLVFSEQKSELKNLPQYTQYMGTRERTIRQCLIVIAAFMSHFFVHGLSASMGVYFEEFLEIFKQSVGDTAWVGSLNYGMLLLTGPVCSVIVDRFGCRVTAMLGGAIAAVGLFLSVFATSLMYLYVSFGIITGFGFGINCFASVFIVGLSFERRRSLAMGISIAGIGAGMMTQPYIIEYLVETYGWRGSLLIQSGFLLQTMSIGAVLHELPPRYQDIPVVATEDTTPKPKIIDFTIFLSFSYVLLCINNFLFCVGLSVVMVHLPHVADVLDFSHKQGAFLLVVIGISNTIGRVLQGVIVSVSCVKCSPTLNYALSYGIAGLATLFFPISRHFILLVICSVIYGLGYSAFGTLLPDVIIAILGKRRLTVGYGVVMNFGGFGTMLGAPIAGWLYDGLHNYQPSFYFGGTSLILSGLIMFIPWYRMRQTASDDEKKDVITDI